jgi:6-phosphogluconolactonase
MSLMVPRRLALAALLLPAAMMVPALGGQDAQAEKYWLYVGTYTGKKSKGIYRCEFDPATGKLSAPVLAGEATNPSFLAISPDRRFLYAVSEVGNFEGRKTGAVLAFAIDPKTGNLTLLNQQSSEGAGPCHLVVDSKGKHVLAANYGGGNACVLPVGEDGKLGKATGFAQHKPIEGAKGKKQVPLAHSINLDAANRFAFVADAGVDRVFVYRFDPAKGTITPNDPPAAELAPLAAPRHFAFHPSGKYAYAINERANTVTAFAYDADKGVLKELQTVSTLPADFKGTSYTAEVVVHPSGKFLYGSNRGHDSIVVYTIDAATGKLTLVGHQGEKVKTPRNFNLDPTGTWLLVGSQAADSIVVFRIDPKSGALLSTGTAIEVPTPVCLKFLPVK